MNERAEMVRGTIWRIPLGELNISFILMDSSKAIAHQSLLNTFCVLFLSVFSIFILFYLYNAFNKTCSLYPFCLISISYCL